MGWEGTTFDHKVTPQDVKKYVADLWNEPRFTVKKHEVHGSTHALVVHVADKGNFAVVALTNVKGNELAVKTINEDCLPVALPVTKKFLDMLAPTEDKMTLEWRARCEKERERKVFIAKHLPGSIRKVTFDEDYVSSFSWDGIQLPADEGVLVIKAGKKLLAYVEKEDNSTFLGTLPHGWRKHLKTINNIPVPSY